MIRRLLDLTLVRAANWALDRVFGPPKPPSKRIEESMPLRPIDAEIQAKASREAGRDPLPPEVLAGALQDRIHDPSGKLLRATPIVTSPRAITTRHAIPPPRKR